MPAASRTPPTDDLTQDIEFLLARAAALGAIQANQNLRDLDLRATSYSVLTLACREHASSQRSLADLLCVDASRIVALVDALEARGLVKRESSPLDRRQKVIVATAVGRSVWHAARDAVKRAEDVSLAGLDHLERDQLRSLLARVALARL